MFRSNQDIVNQSLVQVSDRNLFDLERGRSSQRFGPLDTRMGISGKHEHCATCNEPLQACNGHFGHVKLCLPVFHVGYFKKVISILHSVCKVLDLSGWPRQDLQDLGLLPHTSL